MDGVEGAVEAAAAESRHWTPRWRHTPRQGVANHQRFAAHHQASDPVVTHTTPRVLSGQFSSIQLSPLLGMGSEQEYASASPKGVTVDEFSSDGQNSAVLEKKKAPWWSYIWDYEPGRSQEERVFIQKLDVFLITMLSFGYFIKNLDQTNISNAFVSGMKEDLAMNGNEINLIDTAWTVGCGEHIMDGIISLPICIAGYFFLPDLPENTRAFYLTENDRELARRRMESVGRAPRTKLGRSAFKRIFGRWHVYFLTILYIIFINIGPSSSVNPFSLWLKSKGESVEKINIIPTAASAIQLVLTVSFAILSDAIRHRASVMSISTFLGGFAALILAIWNVPDGLKWFAFLLQRASVPYGPLSMSWTNEICGADAEERAIVIGIMNSLGYAFNVWVPILTYPQVDSPKFKKGFIFSTIAFGAQALITATVAFLYKRDKKKEGITKRDEEGVTAPASVPNAE
ncbi:major facilitator superfamily transporter [Colletotrichum tamarilloi]|uniref:Major facilitator superfamily transporter n=1 Tax=Colletotrichum tamarilloi TaxID=1209934 RepID=A0ABQ9REU6_9PEZI|nr:major facilitator superfamily transporter [Colletotrichum tamarilloi]KAK1502323.1 major facilitator superfamily transporter [Colletotrichum tamarilloi]